MDGPGQKWAYHTSLDLEGVFLFMWANTSFTLCSPPGLDIITNLESVIVS